MHYISDFARDHFAFAVVILLFIAASIASWSDHCAQQEEDELEATLDAYSPRENRPAPPRIASPLTRTQTRQSDPRRTTAIVSAIVRDHARHTEACQHQGGTQEVTRR